MYTFSVCLGKSHVFMRMSQEGYTAFMAACWRGHLPVAQILLKAGCNPHDSVVRTGTNPIRWMCHLTLNARAPNTSGWKNCNPTSRRLESSTYRRAVQALGSPASSRTRCLMWPQANEARRTIWFPPRHLSHHEEEGPAAAPVEDAVAVATTLGPAGAVTMGRIGTICSPKRLRLAKRSSSSAV